MNESLGGGVGTEPNRTACPCPCLLTASTCLAQEDDLQPPHLHPILLCSTWAPKTRRRHALDDWRETPRHKGDGVPISCCRMVLFTSFSPFLRNTSYLQSPRNNYRHAGTNCVLC